MSDIAANERCSNCGEPLEIFDDPAPDTLTAIPKYEEFLAEIEMLTGASAQAVQLGYCMSCHSTVLLGPVVTLIAEVLADEET